MSTLFLRSLRLALAEDQDAGGQAGAVEQIRAEADDGFEQVHAEDLLPDLAFAPMRKSAPCGSTTAMRPVLGAMDLIMCCTQA